MPSNDCRRPRRRVLRAFGGAFLLVGFMASAIAACGNAGPKTYSDPEYGFSFQYPSGWRIMEVEPSDLPEMVSQSVGAWDPRGSGNEAGMALDFVSVDVFELGTDSGVSTDTLQEEFERWLATTGFSDSTFSVVQDPVTVTVGELDGYQATYTYSENGIDVRVTEYWLLSDDVLYDLYTSASEDHWEVNSAEFAAFLDSFAIEARN